MNDSTALSDSHRQTLRRYRVALLLTAVGGFALSPIVVWLLSFATRGSSIEAGGLFFVIYVVAVGVTYLRLYNFRCPRCGHRFCLQLIGVFVCVNPFARKCGFCGLLARDEVIP
jgi:hypothetical protein